MSATIIRKSTIHGGEPVVAGTRVPVSVLVGYTFKKDGLAKARAEYPHLTKRQILAAWTYAEGRLLTSLHAQIQEI